MKGDKRITLEVPKIGKITTTLWAFNDMACLFGEAATRYHYLGLASLESSAQAAHNYIYHELESRGFYD